MKPGAISIEDLDLKTRAELRLEKKLVPVRYILLGELLSDCRNHTNQDALWAIRRALKVLTSNRKDRQ